MPCIIFFVVRLIKLTVCIKSSNQGKCMKLEFKLGIAKIGIGLTLLGLASSPEAFSKGGTSSGGGQGVIFPDGTVHLVDFIDAGKIPSVPVTEEFIQNEFFPKKSRYVKRWAVKDEHFFDCAKEVFVKSGVPSLTDLANKLSSVMVYQSEVRLTKTLEEAPAEGLFAAYATISKKVPVA